MLGLASGVVLGLLNYRDMNRKNNFRGVSNELYKKLNDSIHEYVDLFCIKHNLYFEFWVADLTGTICCLSNEYYVNFEDIRLDLEKSADKHLFFEWYDKSLEQSMNKEPTINYYTYLKVHKNL